jgi:chloramphenicol O-acetyltransferase
VYDTHKAFVNLTHAQVVFYDARDAAKAVKEFNEAEVVTLPVLPNQSFDSLHYAANQDLLTAPILLNLHFGQAPQPN